MSERELRESMDLISVIVPIYNVEKYLRQCLDSLAAQTYKNIEVIMVDDGSPDNCGAICDEYSKRYSNFIAVHKENAGLGMARNTGMEHMNGEYVMFIDSDDYISDDLIEVLYQAIKKNNVDIAKGGFYLVKDDGSIYNKRIYKDEVFEGKKAAIEFLPRLIGSSPEKKDSFEMSACASLYRTSHIKTNDIRFPSERDLISEDMVFNISYAQYADGACTVSKTGYNYRLNPSSLTKSYRSNRFEMCTKFYHYVKDMLTKLGYGIDTQYRLDRSFFVYTCSCIEQEVVSANRLTFKHRINNVKKICKDPILQNAIYEYPVNRLGFAQRYFLLLVKHKCILILYLYFSIARKKMNCPVLRK